eukprot:Sdes_comp20687_c0_seq1m16221
MSLVSEFYKDKTVFVTGATGFVGGLIVEKLLRCQPDIREICVLVRKCGKKTAEERFHGICQGEVFRIVKEISPNFEEKIRVFSGDLVHQNFGVAEEDFEYIVENVDIILHSAADIDFSKPLKKSFENNVKSLDFLLQVAAQCKHLQSFVHVSTAYVNCQDFQVEEKIATHSMTVEQLEAAFEWMTDEQIDTLTPFLLNGRPNTYTLTKSLSETLCKSIVISSLFVL